jgi:hypothetical protein
MSARRYLQISAGVLGAVVSISQVSATDVLDPLRRLIRADPLVVAVIDALAAKHGGCPIQELPTQDGMRVMKEVEPLWYQEPVAASLEVRVSCWPAVSATVHALYDDRRPETLVQTLRKIEFHYDELIPYLSKWPATSSTPEYMIMNDPVVLTIYPVLAQSHKKCESAASRHLTVMDKPQYHDGGWTGKALEYRGFDLSLLCSGSSSASTTTYRFSGKYFTDSGFVAWDTISLWHTVE